ncbi:hypothetical protein CEXT_92191 [Caerostris extrusa]|uniref:Uncharacterized protein n=1 Tax=Caerostris extrusa TaxID=172846 RepID=A0AAV4UH62_CAEEX|nr:hypothetical protein CEXT_92191 [Caerostris extrusa]
MRRDCKKKPSDVAEKTILHGILTEESSSIPLIPTSSLGVNGAIRAHKIDVPFLSQEKRGSHLFSFSLSTYSPIFPNPPILIAKFNQPALPLLILLSILRWLANQSSTLPHPKRHSPLSNRPCRPIIDRTDPLHQRGGKAGGRILLVGKTGVAVSFLGSVSFNA